MRNPAILLPVIALAIWTVLILGLMPLVRFAAVRRGEAKVDDFRYGESASVPARVSLPNRNYMNLLELPVLFYVVCIVLFETGAASHVTVLLAWLFVVARVVHSLVHVTVNRFPPRFAAFSFSVLVLVALLVVAALHLLAMPPL